MREVLQTYDDLIFAARPPERLIEWKCFAKLRKLIKHRFSSLRLIGDELRD